MKHISAVPVKNMIGLLGGVVALLLVPLTLTLLNPNASLYGGPGGGWDWGPMDFVIMGALLFATAWGAAFAIRNIVDPTRRAVAVMAIVAALVVIWVELAVDGVSQLISFLM